jgi:hypothetical protein
VLDRRDAAGVEWWVDGGWGVDALLGGETRLHDDLDVVVRREEIERLSSLFPSSYAATRNGGRRASSPQWRRTADRFPPPSSLTNGATAGRS